uniref:(northern house mosquito) hypothetical protein n=1 Tax=Culex pipiens TaxID=7175 RepID=A0A8D8CFL1_CULPI
MSTVTPNRITNRSDANPITITAMAHCGRKRSSSSAVTVGRICFGMTVKSVDTGSTLNLPSRNTSFTRGTAVCKFSFTCLLCRSSPSSPSSSKSVLGSGVVVVGTGAGVNASWNSFLISSVLTSRVKSVNSTK